MNRFVEALDRWSRVIWGTKWTRWIALIAFAYLILRFLSEA